MTDEIKIDDPAAVLAALERAKADAKKFREAAEELEVAKKGLEEQVANLKNSDSDWKTRYVKSLAESRAVEKGINASYLGKYVSLDEVTVDDDGKLIGLDEAVAKAKTDFPELFDVKRRVGGGADVGTKDTPNAQKSLTELQVDRLFQKK